MRAILTDHARKKAWERYGLALIQADVEAILAACQKGEAVLVRTKIVEVGALRELWMMSFRGKRINFATSSNREVLITFFPENYFQAGESRRRGHWRRQTKRAYPADFSMSRYQ